MTPFEANVDLARGVLVIGAGPAGAGAAAALARAGVPVLVVDRKTFPRSKPCGDGIGPHALDCLREVGFDTGVFERAGYPRAERALFVSPGGVRWRARLVGPSRDPRAAGHGHVVPRRVFDLLVLEHAVRAGARFAPGWRFVGLERRAGRVDAVTLEREADGDRDGDGGGADPEARRRVTLRPRFLLAADGEHSEVRRALAGGRHRTADWLAVRGYVDGLARPPPADLEFHFTRAVAPGYAWVFPVGDPAARRANVGVYVPHRAIARGVSIRRLLDAFVAGAGRPAGPLEGARPCGPAEGYPICTYGPLRRVVFGNALLLGDAAGLADPLTGEGIYPALRSGLLAARTVARALARGGGIRAGGDAAELALYPRLLARAFAATKLRGEVAVAILERLPALVDGVFARARDDERLSISICRYVSGDASISGLFSLSLWTRLALPRTA